MTASSSESKYKSAPRRINAVTLSRDAAASSLRLVSLRLFSAGMSDRSPGFGVSMISEPVVAGVS